LFCCSSRCSVFENLALAFELWRVNGIRCCSQMCGTGCSVPCCKSPVYPVCRPTLSLPTSRVASVCVGQHKHQPQRWSCNWQQYSICFGVTLSIELWPVAAACLASYWALVRLLMLATGIAMLMVLAGLTGTLMSANTTHLGNDVRSATDAVQLPTSLINQMCIQRCKPPVQLLLDTRHLSVWWPEKFSLICRCYPRILWGCVEQLLLNVQFRFDAAYERTSQEGTAVCVCGDQGAPYVCWVHFGTVLFCQNSAISFWHAFQYHTCWCPVPFHCQGISRYDIERTYIKVLAMHTVCWSWRLHFHCGREASSRVFVVPEWSVCFSACSRLTACEASAGGYADVCDS